MEALFNALLCVLMVAGATVVLRKIMSKAMEDPLKGEKKREVDFVTSLNWRMPPRKKESDYDKRSR